MIDKSLFKLAPVLLALFLIDPTESQAVTKKQLQKDLEKEIVVTKRSLLGTVKKPGTVFIARREGIPVSGPKVATRSVAITDDGIDRTDLGDEEDLSRRDLRIGDRLRVYKVIVADESVGLYVATETKSEYLAFGIDKVDHLTGVLEFKLGSSVENFTAKEIVQKIGNTLVRESDLIDNGPLRTAMETLRGTAVPFAPATLLALEEEKKEEAAKAASKQARMAEDRATREAPVTVKVGRSQFPSNSKTSYREWTEDSPRQISCEMAAWEGVVENIADLFECDTVKAIKSLSSGREVSVKIGSLSFTDGQFLSETTVTPSWVDIRWSQLESIPSASQRMMYMSSFSGRSSGFKIYCRFSPETIGDTQDGSVVTARARLTDYSDKRVVLNCEL